MNTTLEKLKERIKDKKYKLTTQRQTILQAFIDAEENHLSAEDVYVLVKEVHLISGWQQFTELLISSLNLIC